MAETIMINAEARNRAGKGAARATRREGKVPAVLYGDKKPPVSLTLQSRELARLMRDPSFFSTLYTVKLGDKQQKALAREVQKDPVTDAALHVDFLRVSERTRVTSDVPVHFINEEESPGLRVGGVLNIVRHAVEVSCRADAIPEAITIDLTGRELNDSIHISAVTLPDGVTPTITDRDFTIATIAAPSALRSEDEASSNEDSEGEGSADEEAGEDG